MEDTLRAIRFLNKHKVFLALLFVVCLGASFIYVQQNKSVKKRSLANAKEVMAKIKQSAEVGDIIFRRGLNTESDIITYISHSPFSHIGMVVSLEPFSIIHASTDDDKMHLNQVIISSLEDFLTQGNSVGLRRLDLPQELRAKIAEDSLAFLTKPFVLSTDSTRFYCTTFLLDIISQRVDFEVDFINVDFAFLGGEYLFPSAFWNHKKTFEIISVSEF